MYLGMIFQLLWQDLNSFMELLIFYLQDNYNKGWLLCIIHYFPSLITSSSLHWCKCWDSLFYIHISLQRYWQQKLGCQICPSIRGMRIKELKWKDPLYFQKEFNKPCQYTKSCLHVHVCYWSKWNSGQNYFNPVWFSISFVF